jgi:hypothetical protein
MIILRKFTYDYNCHSSLLAGFDRWTPLVNGKQCLFNRYYLLLLIVSTNYYNMYEL